MVEFAIVASVLLLVLVGILYFGRFLNYLNDETHLAEEAARYAAVLQMPTGCATTLATCVQSQAAGELKSGSGDASKAQVCVALASGATGQAGDAIQATVTSQFHFLPLLGFLNSVVPLSTETATMRLEQPLGTTTGIIGCS